MTDALYADYAAWKGWTNPFQWDREVAAYYAAELRGIALDGKRVLEIGFGNGEFLGWAKSQGATIAGSELTASAVAAAKAFGLPLLSPDFEIAPPAGQFDLIAAFDVFEHLDAATIIAKLTAIDSMLAPGGLLLLRYPNGQSPFGLAPQHADATHVTALSQAKIEQYASGTALKTVRYGGAARGRSPSVAKRCVRAIRYTLRDLHGALIRFLYATDAETEPVVTQLLRKDGPPADRP